MGFLYLKVEKTSVTLGGNELSRFSDSPGDSSLDDLFPLEKSVGDQATEASTSASTSNANQNNQFVPDGGNNGLAAGLRATIAQKQMTNGGGNLFRLMMGVLKDDGIDIDGLVCLALFILSGYCFQ